MYFPRLKKFKTRREKIVSELVEAMDINNDSYKNRILKELEEGKLF